MTTRLIIALSLFGACFAGRIIYDVFVLYFGGKTNKHTKGPLITAAVIIICSWLAGWFTGFMWAFAFMALFDPLYGISIGQGPGYLGTTAKLDRVQHRYPWLVWLKYIGAFAFTLLFILSKVIPDFGFKSN